VTRHPADLLSLVAGLAVLGLGLLLLSGGVGDLPMEWAGPLVAIGGATIARRSPAQASGSSMIDEQPVLGPTTSRSYGRRLVPTGIDLAIPEGGITAWSGRTP
jgi:hypothetical protein